MTKIKANQQLSEIPRLLYAHVTPSQDVESLKGQTKGNGYG